MKPITNFLYCYIFQIHVIEDWGFRERSPNISSMNRRSSKASVVYIVCDWNCMVGETVFGDRALNAAPSMGCAGLHHSNDTSLFRWRGLHFSVLTSCEAPINTRPCGGNSLSDLVANFPSVAAHRFLSPESFHSLSSALFG